MFREDLSRNFGFLVNDVARLLRTAYDRRVRALGLTRSQWWVVTHLFRASGVTQSELAEMLEIEKPTQGLPPHHLSPDPYDKLDGFSPVVQILMHFEGGVDPAASNASRLLPENVRQYLDFDPVDEAEDGEEPAPENAEGERGRQDAL